MERKYKQIPSTNTHFGLESRTERIEHFGTRTEHFVATPCYMDFVADFEFVNVIVSRIRNRVQ
jgi:hypothetical protein